MCVITATVSPTHIQLDPYRQEREGVWNSCMLTACLLSELQAMIPTGLLHTEGCAKTPQLDRFAALADHGELPPIWHQ